MEEIRRRIRRSQSRHFKKEDFDQDGLLIHRDGIIEHNGNVRFEENLGDIQIQRIIAGGDVTSGPGTNLLLKGTVYSGGEINVKGSLESEDSVEARYGIFVAGDLRSWEDIKSSSITSKNLLSFGNVFSKHSIIVNGDIKVYGDLGSGSDISITGKTSVSGSIRTMGFFKSKSKVKCMSKFTAKNIYIKSDLFVELGIEVLEKVKVRGSMKVNGNVIIPVRLDVGGDLEHIGYVQCPLIVCNGDIYLIEL